MRKDHYLGLLGKKPVSIRLLWTEGVEETCLPILAKQEPRLMVQRRDKPKGQLELPPYADVKYTKQTLIDLATATALTQYLSTKIPPDALQDVLGTAAPQSLTVRGVTLNAAQNKITKAEVAVAYPPEEARGQGRQVNLTL